MFNVPGVVIGTSAVLVLVHVIRVYLLSPEQDLLVLLRFAFIPARYDPTLLRGGAFPGGTAADVWSFVTYALIHADAMHLGFNALWLLAFGSALARRFGAWRFLLFLVVTAAAGALAHLITHPSEMAPAIGASAAISGTMAAAMRFAFQRGGPLGLLRAGDADAYRVPAAPLLTALREPSVLGFLLAWFGLNALFGLGGVPILGDGQVVAWEAHIGGFVAGLILFPLFDPVPPASADDRPEAAG
jgi:membrane associated rhomboid family serine protease